MRERVMTISGVNRVEIYRTTRDSHQVFEVRQLAYLDDDPIWIDHHPTLQKAIEDACDIALARGSHAGR